MESLNTTSFSLTPLQEFISHRTWWLTALVLRVCLNPILALCGCISNVANCIIFRRLGLDNSPESFFILSLSDCLVSFFDIVGTAVNIMRYLGPPDLRVSMYTLYLQGIIPAYVVSITSIVATTVISVVRCCCVAMPFRVREFTAPRQRLSILGFTAICVVLVGYGVSSTRLEIETNNQTSTSHLVLRVLPDYLEKNKFSNFYRVTMFLTCFITINACPYFLTVALRRYTMFRLEASRDAAGTYRQTLASHGRSKRLHRFRLSIKDARVVQVIVLVSAVFTVCNIPTMVGIILSLAVPGMSITGALHRSFDFTMMVVEVFSLINASANIIIYFKFNTRYKKAFLEVMRAKTLKR